jgi:O-antigen ligase
MLINAFARHWPHLLSTDFDGRTVADFILNRSVSATALFFWPMMLTGWYWLRPCWRRAFVGVALLVTLPVVVMTESQSAQVAYALGGLCFVLASKRPQLLSRLFTAAWTLAVVAIVPIVMLLHSLDLQRADYLPLSFKERIAIWHATALEVGEHPLLGVGVQADRFNALRKQQVVDRTEDHLGWHSHDLFLQVWHELGAVGAALLLVLGYSLLWAISRLADPVQAYGFATFASVCGLAAFGYGAWQSWLLACYAWTGIFLIIGIQVQRRRAAPALR